MSTHACIALKTTPECIRWIYLHADGYPAWCGRQLSRFYNTYAKASELIALGDLSTLHRRLAPSEGEVHTFLDRVPDVTTAYHRDRNEPLHIGTLQTRGKTETEIIQELAEEAGSSYVYLFDVDVQGRKGGWLLGSPCRVSEDVVPSIAGGLQPGLFYLLESSKVLNQKRCTQRKNVV